jgi:hypothetical protein
LAGENNELLPQDPGYAYGSVLPIRVKLDASGQPIPGTHELALPGMLRSAVNDLALTVTAPGLAAQGKLSNEQALAAGPRMAQTLLNTGLGSTPLLAKGAGPVMGSFTGWHGTPHLFEPVEHNPFGEFRDSAIGSGEGAQVYGHGHYVAGARETAEEYQKNLSNSTVSFDGKLIPSDNSYIINTSLTSLQPPEHTAAAIFKAHEGSLPHAIGEVQGRMQNIDHKMEQAEDAGHFGDSDMYSKSLDHLTEVENLLQSQGKKFKLGSSGNLLHLQIRPEESQLLDWNKKLSEQHPEVLSKLQALPEHFQQALYNHAENHGMNSPLESLGDYTGEEFINSASHHNVVDDPADVSDMLSKAGIPGIRYLDGFSRNFNPEHGGVTLDGQNMTGAKVDSRLDFKNLQNWINKNPWSSEGFEGTEPLFGGDNHAHASQSGLDLLHKYGSVDKAIAGAEQGMVAAGSGKYPQGLTDSLFHDSNMTAQWLADNRDKLGFAPPAKATSNYVIFNPKDIDITARNGQRVGVAPEEGIPAFHGTLSGDIGRFNEGTHFGTAQAATERMAHKQIEELHSYNDNNVRYEDIPHEAIKELQKHNSVLTYDQAKGDLMQAAHLHILGDPVYNELLNKPGSEHITKYINDVVSKAPTQPANAIYPVRLHSKNILDVPDLGEFSTPDFAEHLLHSDLINPDTYERMKNGELDPIEHIKSKGIDTLRYRNDFEHNGSTSYMVLDPSIIKRTHRLVPVDYDPFAGAKP